MHDEKLERMCFRGLLGPIGRPLGRVREGDSNIEPYRVVALLRIPKAPQKARPVVLHQAQLELPRHSIITGSNGVLQRTLDITAFACLPYGSNARMLGC